MLSWCLFLSDSFFSLRSGDIAPALCLRRIAVEGLLLFLFCSFIVLLIRVTFVFGMLMSTDI